MSGIFSLGVDNNLNQNNKDPTDSSSSSLFLLKNEEIYSRGFELWQHYYHHHHHHNHHHNHRLLQLQQQHNLHDGDFSVGPTTTRRNNNTNNNNNISSGTGDDQGSSHGGFRVTRRGEGVSCQDCGNQAKKDCDHLRCRTCCKSRGFTCQTHVKSTWVPAATRRHRQQQLVTRVGGDGREDRLQIAAGKRIRENQAAAGAGAASGFELGHFPAEVSSPATFRCVRVSAVDEAEEHLAYQTAVKIGGHVFKGILYDQGPKSRYSLPGGEGSSLGSQPLGLIADAPSSQNMTAVIDQSVYPTPLSAFVAGTQFFPPPRT